MMMFIFSIGYNVSNKFIKYNYKKKNYLPLLEEFELLQ